MILTFQIWNFCLFFMYMNLQHTYAHTHHVTFTRKKVSLHALKCCYLIFLEAFCFTTYTLILLLSKVRNNKIQNNIVNYTQCTNLRR